VVRNNAQQRVVMCRAVEITLDKDGKAPSRIMLIPKGPKIRGWDGRSWNLKNPAVIVQAFKRRGIQLPVDFEHSTHLKAPKGERADAVGYITGLEVVNGALWGDVDWNEDGRSAIEGKKYKYISPAWPPSGDRSVKELLSAGLTNEPNLSMPALNAAGHEADMPYEVAHPDILEALGMDDDAGPQDCVDAINALKPTGNATRRGFVPKADYTQVLNRATVAETALAEIGKRDFTARKTAAVDKAITDGHLAPASKGYHLNSIKTEADLVEFNAFVPTQPKLVEPSGLDKREVPTTQTMGVDANGLTPAEAMLCEKMKLDPKKFIANRTTVSDLTTLR
jgi:phage I-like protein